MSEYRVSAVYRYNTVLNQVTWFFDCSSRFDDTQEHCCSWGRGLPWPRVNIVSSPPAVLLIAHYLMFLLSVHVNCVYGYCSSRNKFQRFLAKLKLLEEMSVYVAVFASRSRLVHESSQRVKRLFLATGARPHKCICPLANVERFERERQSAIMPLYTSASFYSAARNDGPRCETLKKERLPSNMQECDINTSTELQQCIVASPTTTTDVFVRNDS